MKRSLDSLRRAVSWHRRALAAIAAALATVALGSLLAQPDPPSQWVIVTTGTVEAGATVTADDISREKRSTSAIPDGATTDADDVVGHMALGPLPRNTILTSGAVFTPGDVQASPGMAIMPVTLPATGLRGLLTVGAHVDLIGFSAATGRAQVIAEEVRIVAIPQSESGGTFDTGTDGGLLVLVEVQPAVATDLMTASAASTLNVILR